MRILVISDSHGNFYLLNKIIKNETYDAVIFLGDGAKDMTEIAKSIDKPVYILLGNNDFFVKGKESLVLNIEGKTLFACHGHNHYVKSTRDYLKAEARKHGADIVLYGHTHDADILYENGVYYLNPGSLYCAKKGYLSVMLLDIGDYGIMPIIKKV